MPIHPRDRDRTPLIPGTLSTAESNCEGHFGKAGLKHVELTGGRLNWLPEEALKPVKHMFRRPESGSHRDNEQL